MNWSEMALVGRVARAHGIRGQVIVNPETDFPEERFRPGAELFVEREGRIEPLAVTTARLQNGRPVIGIAGIATMSEAETLAGLELRVPADRLAPLPPNVFYRHDLVGCRVVGRDGRDIGVVEDVEGTLGGSRLVVRGSRPEMLIPLAADICREIDTTGRRIVIDPPDGLLELND